MRALTEKAVGVSGLCGGGGLARLRNVDEEMGGSGTQQVLGKGLGLAQRVESPLGFARGRVAAARSYL